MARQMPSLTRTKTADKILTHAADQSYSRLNLGEV